MKIRSLLGIALAAMMAGGSQAQPMLGLNYNYSRMYYPSRKRTKHKGWMREKRRSTFNKNK